jgi:hypothetical protein
MEQVARLQAWRPGAWPPLLRRAVLQACALAALGLLLAGAFHWWRTDLAGRLERQLKAEQTSRQRFFNSGRERSNIERLLPLLQSLQSRGLYGEEKRLEWIERLRGMERRWPGLKLQYTIDAQAIQPAANAGAGNTAGPASLPLPGAAGDTRRIEMFYTRMRLTMTLVHEEDMLRVLDDLAQAQLGRVSVERCEMSRANAAAIRAECALVWHTLRTYEPPARTAGGRP